MGTMDGADAACDGAIHESGSSSRQFELLRTQPKSRPISQEELAAEVKSIYTRLSMVEEKCIQMYRTQPNQHGSQSSKHWQALLALHRTLLHEHHDFFLASSHPSISSALRRLVAKYSMPARMWKQGIQSFLNLARRRASAPFMIAFIYLVFQLLAILYETVPTSQDTWIECVGDLGRHRMAVEDEHSHGNVLCERIERSWYREAVNRNPQVGRLYHHLAILSQPNLIQQLHLYQSSLSPVQPTSSSHESILNFLNPISDQVSTPERLEMLPVNWDRLEFVKPRSRDLSWMHLDQMNMDYLKEATEYVLYGGNRAKWTAYGFSDASFSLELETPLRMPQTRASAKYGSHWSYPPGNLKPAQKTQVFEIPSTIEVEGQNKTGNALADYCAKSNFINERYAREQGLTIKTSVVNTVAIGSGKRVKTTGSVETVFRFEGEPEKSYTTTFHVLPDCIHNLILGKPFLKATRTLSSVTNFARRVRTRLIDVARRHLLYLGASAPKFSGLINGEESDALADSGSNMLIMDEDYARSLELPIADSKTRLLFADGSHAYTSGITRGVTWQFGHSDTEEHFLDFHILKNAPAPVILSDNFLFGSQAYSKYECYLKDEEEDEMFEEDDFLFTISYDPTYQSGGAVDMSTIANMEYAEASRRSQQEDIIVNLRSQDRAAAWVEENERRAKFDQDIALLRQNQPLNSQLPMPLATSANGSTPTGPTAQHSVAQPMQGQAAPGNSNTPQTAGSQSKLSTAKRLMRFKLRRRKNQ